MLTTSLLIVILLCVDVAVYLLFIRTATQNEVEQLHDKWEPIAEKTGVEAVQNAKVDLSSYLTEDMMIRIFDAQSRLIHEYRNGANYSLSDITFDPNIYSTLANIDDRKILIVHLPMMSGSERIGTFEISEKWDTLDTNMEILVSILTFSTIGAIIACIFGGILISRTIVKPIASSIQTMQEIESSLLFKKIPVRGNSNAELYKMTETFNRMIDRLEESFVRQQQFVSDASHELNTTVTIVQGYASMLRRWGNQDKEIQNEAVNSIFEETKRMRIMTQQLLDLASFQHGVPLKFEKFDLAECCSEVISNLKQLYPRDIKLYNPQRKLNLYADRTKIKQLLLILGDNALKYSSETVEFHISSEEGNAVIYVKDYGIGIPADEVHHVFERFYRVDSSRHRKTGGTGLGLPIAKSIAQEHQGSISIVSTEGAGTEVKVEIPMDLIERSAK
nr:HAMP domain-containing sensor histidine kinase [Paenibacillus mangrovi]